jgi:hypothetical protein
VCVSHCETTYRVNALLTGVGPGGIYKLDGTTVFGDSVGNALTGGAALDWFFAGLADRTDATNLGLYPEAVSTS